MPEHTYVHSDSSMEIGQTAKGAWYVKSVKLYFNHGQPIAVGLNPGAFLLQMREQAEAVLPGAEEEGEESA